MGNRNATSSSGVSSYNNSPSRIQRPSSASSFRSSSRYRSDRGRSSSSLSNDSYPLSTLNKLHNSDDSSPLINKLRDKVASRMLGFKAGNGNSENEPPHFSSHSQSTSNLLGPGGNTSANSGRSSVSGHRNNSVQLNGRPNDQNSVFPKLKSQSSLTNDQLTAHLTEEERLILQKVFQKEEEFHREASSKRQMKTNSSDKKDGLTISSPTAQSPSASAQLIGNCRTCRKKILTTEVCNYCDTCSEPICEDCSSYSDKSKEKLWMCSFCRRRGTQPAVATLTELGLTIPSSLVTGRRRSTIVTMKDSFQNQRRPSNIETTTDRSAVVDLKSELTLRAPGLNHQQGIPINATLTGRYDATSGRNFMSTSGGLTTGQQPQRRYSSIVVSKTRYSSAEGLDERRTSDEAIRSVSAMSDGLKRNEIDQFRSRDGLLPIIGNQPLTGNNMMINPNHSALPNETIQSSGRVLGKSFSASDSSLEDYIMDSTTLDSSQQFGANSDLSTLKRRRSQRSRSVHQSARKLVNPDELCDPSNLHNQQQNPHNHLQYNPGGSLTNTPTPPSVISSHYNPNSNTNNNNMLGSTNPLICASYGAINSSESSSSWEPGGRIGGVGITKRNNQNNNNNIYNLPIIYNENNANYHHNMNNLINSGSSGNGGGGLNSSNTNSNLNGLRHIASDVALYTPSTTDLNRRKSDSQSSEFSDIRIPSPPQESMSPSSPDFSRSPRESADSDMLGLPTIGPLPTQRRSIPSVLVDNGAVDNHHLTLKDCFPRRSSTGRALPRIPSEQSRSLLELPQGRTLSTHSLDLPNTDQPQRRASAPEGENITIVIDDVDSAGLRKSNSQIERIILHRDETDLNPRTHGFGLIVMGGKMSETDGKLYAYVAYIVPGGSADKMSLKSGDKILEWDRKSLVNCTFEQVCSIIESSQNTVELLIEPYCRTERRGALIHQRRRLSQAFSQSGSDIYSSPPVSPSYRRVDSSDGGSTANVNRSGRKLPRTPESIQAIGQGEILIQCWVDLERNELVITIICAKGLTTNKRPCFARVRIIPEMGFKCCQTELSNGLEWNETVIIQKFPIEKITEMALEIGIWETSGTSDKPELLGETMIPMESAIAHNTDWWPLLLPQYLYNLARSSSLDTLAVKPIGGDGGYNCLSESKSVPSSRRNSGRSDIVDPLRVINNLNPLLVTTSSQSVTSPTRTMSLRMGRTSSDAFVHHSGIQGGNGGIGGGSGTLITNNSGTSGPTPSLTLEPPPLSPRRKSASSLIMSNANMNRSFSLKSNPDISLTSDSTIIGSTSIISKGSKRDGGLTGHNNDPSSGYNNSDSDSEGGTSESDSINTSTLSQMDCDLDSSRIVGELKLGMIMTKGVLEVEVIAARGLISSNPKHPPDTYVKAYIKDGSRHYNKKKTRIIQANRDPQYRQLLKYDAGIFYGRSLLISVWQRHRGFEHNTPLGAVNLPVNTMPLTKLTIGWYKLYAFERSS